MADSTCPTCAAHVDQIAYLRSQVEKLQDKLMALSDPMVAARLQATAGPVRETKPAQPPRVKQAAASAMERLSKDEAELILRAEGASKPPAELDRAEIEDEFRVKE